MFEFLQEICSDYFSSVFLFYLRSTEGGKKEPYTVPLRTQHIATKEITCKCRKQCKYNKHNRIEKAHANSETLQVAQQKKKKKELSYSVLSFLKLHCIEL